MSIRDQILSAAKLASEPITVPEWGIEGLAVRVMTMAERDSFNAESYAFRQQGLSELTNMSSRLVVRTLIDGDGNRVFSDADAEQLGREQPARVLRPIYEAASRINEISDKSVENLEKNSAAAPSGSSSST